MKNKWLGIIFVLAFVPFLSAQVLQGTSNVSSRGGDDVRLGVKAGLSLSTFSGNDFLSVDPKLGFYVGGVVEIPAFLDEFYFQPEVLLQLQGSGIESDELNLLYLHLPLMGKYYITDHIALELGPQLGFLLAENWDEDFTAVDTKSLHLGLNIGGGYSLNKNIYLHARFSRGLTTVLKGFHTKNVAFQLGASYFF